MLGPGLPPPTVSAAPAGGATASSLGDSRGVGQPHTRPQTGSFRPFARRAGEGGGVPARAPLARWRSRRSSAPAPPHGSLHRLPHPPSSQKHSQTSSFQHQLTHTTQAQAQIKFKFESGTEKKNKKRKENNPNCFLTSSHQVVIYHWRDRMPMFLSPPRWISMAIHTARPSPYCPRPTTPPNGVRGREGSDVVWSLTHPQRGRCSGAGKKGESGILLRER